MSNEAAVVTVGTTPLILTAGSNVTLTPAGTTLVVAASGGGGGVTSFKARTGAVVPATGDYTAAQVGALALVGGTLTGTVAPNADGTLDLGSTADGFAHVYAKQLVSTGIDTLDLVTVTDAVRLMPSGVVTFSASQAGPDGTKQVFPGATYTSGSGVSLGGPTRAFKGLWVGGAPPITILGATTTTGASAGTLTNCPAVGNPTGYLQLSINGAIGKIPYWT